MSETYGLAAILAADVRRSALTEWASRAGQIGNDPKPPDFAVNGGDGERRFSSVVTVIGKGAAIGPLPEHCGPTSRRGRDLFVSVYSSTCSEMLSASSISIPS
jgi:hypothetical protein